MKKPRKPKLRTGIISDLTEILLYLTVTLGVLVASSIFMFNAPIPSLKKIKAQNLLAKNSATIQRAEERDSDKTLPTPHQVRSFDSSAHDAIKASQNQASSNAAIHSEILEKIKKNDAEINAQLNRLDEYLTKTSPIFRETSGEINGHSAREQLITEAPPRARLSRFGFTRRRKRDINDDSSALDTVLEASRQEMRRKVANLKHTVNSLFLGLFNSAEESAVTFRRRYLVRELDWLMYYR